MTRLELDLLHTLLTVVDAGSLSAAAPRLHRSQSAVSEQIRKLEQTIGLPLLSRGKSGSVPTPAGERLLGHARRLLELSDAAVRDVQGTQLEGELRLAITEYFRPSGVASILKRIQKTHPGLRLHVSVERSIEIEGAVQKNRFDIGIPMRVAAGLNTRKRMGASVELAREPLRWVADNSFEIERPGPLPLILLSETCSLHRLVLGALRRRRIDFYVAHTTSGVAGAQQALLAGLGLTCLNESAVPGNTQILKPGKRLPRMPDVEFALLARRDTGNPLISRVKEILIEQFSG